MRHATKDIMMPAPLSNDKITNLFAASGSTHTMPEKYYIATSALFPSEIQRSSIAHTAGSHLPVVKD